MLKHSIFGIELHPGAVDLAAFSLALAICDALKPNVIWNELQFDPVLGTNLLEGDFFSLFDEGEPYPLLPSEALAFGQGMAWAIRCGDREPAVRVVADGSRQGDRRSTWTRHRGTFARQAGCVSVPRAGREAPDRAGAAVLAAAVRVPLQPEGSRISQAFFSTVHCQEILDFTSVRNLFDGADPKTVAMHARGRMEEQAGLDSHLTFRRTFSATQRIGFELDHYDRHLHNAARCREDSLYIWRVNLLGGGRLVEMSERFARMREP